MANKIDSVSNQIREENLEDAQTLSVLFDEGLELYNQIGNNQKPSNSPEFQVKMNEYLLRHFSLLFYISDGCEEGHKYI